MKIRIFHFLLLALFSFSACAGLRTKGPSLNTYEKRMEVVSIAKKLIGKKKIMVGEKKYPYDCSGFVCAVYKKALDITFFKLEHHSTKGKNGVDLIFTYLQEHGTLYKSGTPDEGDIIFFDKTYDINKDGSLNDRLTHVGIVEKVDRHKTITFIHLVSGGIERAYMNLKHPHMYINPENKQIYNTPIRRLDKKRKGKELTGEFFHAFGSVF